MFFFYITKNVVSSSKPLRVYLFIQLFEPMLSQTIEPSSSEWLSRSAMLLCQTYSPYWGVGGGRKCQTEITKGNKLCFLRSSVAWRLTTWAPKPIILGHTITSQLQLPPSLSGIQRHKLDVPCRVVAKIANVRQATFDSWSLYKVLISIKWWPVHKVKFVYSLLSAGWPQDCGDLIC